MRCSTMGTSERRPPVPRQFAKDRFPHNTPATKEAYYSRMIFERFYPLQVTSLDRNRCRQNCRTDLAIYSKKT
jgi:hypothetical protein